MVQNVFQYTYKNITIGKIWVNFEGTDFSDSLKLF